MDTIFQEKLNEVLHKWQSLKQQLDALEVEIQELKALEKAHATAPEASFANDDEPIDIVLDDEELYEEAAHEEKAAVEEVPKEEPPLPEPEEDIPEDMPESLFGNNAPPAEEQAGKARRRQPRTLYQSTSTIGQKAVIDVLSAKAAWRSDMPGPEVRSLRSAIALGDQVIFINKLFRKDSSLYQSTIDTLNATATLSEAVRYLSETFPEWDLESEDVYRFMMAVRRKIRK